jgi:uncharacterized membrane protein
MDKKTYQLIRSAVAAGIGIIMALSIIREAYAFAAVSVAVAMLVLYLSKKNVKEVLYDERSAMVQQKAASATVSLVTVGFTVIGIALVEANSLGFNVPVDIGYSLTYVALIILWVHSFFNWYYQNKLGG